MSATAASAGPPLPGATTEAWANPSSCRRVGAASRRPSRDQAAARPRLGVATAAVSTPVEPAAGRPSSRSRIRRAGQPGRARRRAPARHDAPPVIPAQTVTASKNATTIVHVDGHRRRRRPADVVRRARSPTTPGSSVSIPDPARGDFAFNAANDVGTDTFEAVATDGVPATRRGRLINVNVVNDPPKITCTALITREDTPLEIPVAALRHRSERAIPSRSTSTTPGRHRRARRGHVALHAGAATAPPGLLRAACLRRRPEAVTGSCM